MPREFIFEHTRLETEKHCSQYLADKQSQSIALWTARLGVFTIPTKGLLVNQKVIHMG